MKFIFLSVCFLLIWLGFIIKGLIIYIVGEKQALLLSCPEYSCTWTDSLNYFREKILERWWRLCLEIMDIITQICIMWNEHIRKVNKSLSANFFILREGLSQLFLCKIAFSSYTEKLMLSLEAAASFNWENSVWQSA